ncbi:MAG: hypothetical protein J6O04_05445 [Selenomonadaceae bacterium]|nr:hypothetical protein [Selenomonadaceae bacterium]
MKRKSKQRGKRPSPTAYDDSFRTLLNDCSELIIPVVNEVFGERFTGTEKVSLGVNELFIRQDNSRMKKRITDSSFVIISDEHTEKRYHIECEEQLDKSILLRIFEYDAQIALNEGSGSNYSLNVSFPHSAVLALRSPLNSPDKMQICVVTPGGEIKYSVPIIKAQQYGLNEIFEKRLLFLLPFYIFSREKELPECNINEEKLRGLIAEYISIREKLNELQNKEEVTEFTKQAIYATIIHVIELIAQKYDKVRKGVEETMGGKIIEYEAKDILNKGLKRGLQKGRNEERKKATEETEERAKDMLRDKMALPLVEKYTRLSMSRIKELAKGLGVL